MIHSCDHTCFCFGQTSVRNSNSGYNGESRPEFWILSKIVYLVNQIQCTLLQRHALKKWSPYELMIIRAASIFWRTLFDYFHYISRLTCIQKNGWLQLIANHPRFNLRHMVSLSLFLKVCKETRSFKYVMNCLFFCPYDTRMRTYVL